MTHKEVQAVIDKGGYIKMTPFNPEDNMGDMMSYFKPIKVDMDVACFEKLYWNNGDIYENMAMPLVDCEREATPEEIKQYVK